MTALGPDITPLPDLLRGHSRSGPVRERRPVYVDLLPPCSAGCPAGENIQASWGLAQQTVDQRWQIYEAMTTRSASDFWADDRRNHH